MTTLRPLLPLLAGWALLIAAWVGANPPFAGPDESAHYVRALGIAHGHLIGTHSPGDAVAATPTQLVTQRELTYRVNIDGGLQPPPVECYVLMPRSPAGCISTFQPPARPTAVFTWVGNYPPLPYVSIGLASRLGHTPGSALRLGRAAGAVCALMLLAAAAWLVFDGTAISLAGIILAATPMTLYVSSIASGSGLEVMAGMALAAALLRLARGDSRRAVWAIAAVSGAVLALARSLGVLWLALDLIWFAALTGPAGLRRLVDRARPRALAAGAALAVAVILSRLWEALYGQHVPLGVTALRPALRHTLEDVPSWWDHLIGRFGYLELVLPMPVLLLWGFGVVALIALAAGLAARRERLVLLALAAGAFVVVPLTLQIATVRFTGFVIQGRHFLALAVAVPLLAGDIVTRHAAQLGAGARRALAPAVGLIAAVVQLGAWWIYARRSAVGVDGPLVFFGKAAWTPPTGWGLWAALAIAGSLLVAAAPLVRSRERNGRISC